MALFSVTDKRPDAAIDAAIQAAIQQASEEWRPLQFEGEYPIGGFGISEIRPFHIENTTDGIPQISNLNYWQTSCLTGSTWTTWINQAIDRDQYLVVTGIFINEPDPLVTELAITANGQDLPVLNIEQMYALDVARIWFTKPFIVKPNAVLKIQLYGKLGTGTTTSQRIGLLGHCIGKRPRLITTS